MNPTAEEVKPPPTGGFLASSRLIRPTHDRKVAGVCAAVGRATATDPLLWRVILAVLVVFAGAGLVLYAVGWLLFPSEGDEASAAEALFTPRRSSTSVATTVFLMLSGAALATITIINTDGRPFLVFAALVLAIGALAHRRGHEPEPAPVPDEPADDEAYRKPFAPNGPYAADRTRLLPESMAAPTAPEVTLSLPAAPVGESGTTVSAARAGKPVRRKPKTRSRLGLVTVSLIAFAMSIMSIVAMAGASVPFSAFVAVALALCGFGLLIGTWWGRSPTLYILGGLLSVVMVATMVVQGAGISGFGYRSLVPGSVVEIPSSVSVEWGVTEMDLSRVDIADGTEVFIDVEVYGGSMRITVDPYVNVVVNPQRSSNGRVDLDGQEVFGMGLPTVASQGGPGGGTLTIDSKVEFGDLEVTR